MEMTMPNKTIYVSDSDLPLYQRAQELAGGNLSAAIVAALGYYIAMQEGREAGFAEVKVRVGIGKGRQQRFVGLLITKWGRTVSGRDEEFRVYRTPKGNYAVYSQRGPSHTWAKASGDESWLGTVRASFGFGDQSWGETPGDASLEIFPNLESLRERVPAELYELVASVPDPNFVEELDI